MLSRQATKKCRYAAPVHFKPRTTENTITPLFHSNYASTPLTCSAKLRSDSTSLTFRLPLSRRLWNINTQFSSIHSHAPHCFHIIKVHINTLGLAKKQTVNVENSWYYWQKYYSHSITSKTIFFITEAVYFTMQQTVKSSTYRKLWNKFSDGHLLSFSVQVKIVQQV